VGAPVRQYEIVRIGHLDPDEVLVLVAAESACAALDAYMVEADRAIYPPMRLRARKSEPDGEDYAIWGKYHRIHCSLPCLWSESEPWYPHLAARPVLP